MLIVGFSKFVSGAWITILLIPLLVAIFLKIRNHYVAVARQLSSEVARPLARPSQVPRIVIPISSMHQGVLDAVSYALGISKDVTAVYIELEPNTAQEIQALWERWWPDVPLVVVPSPYRTLLKPLFDYLDQLDRQCDDGQLATVVLPEIVPARWWHGFLHNQTAWLIKAALLYRRRHLGFQRTIIDMPYHLQH